MTAQYIVGQKGDTGPQGPPVSDGTKGDIVVSASGTIYTVGANAITLAKFQQIATASILGRLTAATGNVEVLTAANVLSIIGVTAGANVNDVAVQSLTNKKIVLGAGTATAGTSPLKFASGSLLTVPEIGSVEFDGANFMGTIDTASGRGQLLTEQRFALRAAGTAITTIANFFGTTSNISLVAAAWYEIEIYAFFLKGVAGGTVTWTLTNSAVPGGQNIIYEMSPVTGIVAPPGDAAMLQGQIYNDTTAAKTIVTAALTNAVNHFMRAKIILNNGAGTNLKIQATVSAGDITPLIGSYWTAKRISNSNIGTFAA